MTAGLAGFLDRNGSNIPPAKLQKSQPLDDTTDCSRRVRKVLRDLHGVLGFGWEKVSARDQAIIDRVRKTVTR